MKDIKRCFSLILPIAPVRMLIYFLLLLPLVFLPTLLLYFEQIVIDNASALTTYPTLKDHVYPVLLLIGAYSLQKLIELLSMQYMEFGYFRFIIMALDKKIHQKTSGLPLEYYDNAKTYQMIQEARESSMFIVFTANILVQLAILSLTIVSISSYLYVLNPLLIVLTVLISIPVMLEKYKRSKLEGDFIKKTVQPRREMDYAYQLLVNYVSKKEISLHGAADFIVDKYKDSFERMLKEETGSTKVKFKIGLLFSFLKVVIRAIALALIMYLLVTDQITIGSFSVVMSSFVMLTNNFSRFFDFAGEILKTGVLSSSFFELMDTNPAEEGTKKLEGKKNFIQLNDVSYAYPNADFQVLENISFTLNYGDTIAIVGENGAGKSTLAKMMSGFLKPTKGSLSYEGNSRNEFTEENLLSSMSAVYQEYGKYKLTLEDNVRLSDPKKEADLERIQTSLGWAGLTMKKDQIKHTIYGKEFGGEELSGGQWQRIALSRCYYRDRPIVFLDEPTAAIDPMQEADLYSKMKELAKSKTMILITHRLGMVRNANKIIVLEKGKIAEMGDFESLIQKQGAFYNIWNEQTKWYQSN